MSRTLRARLRSVAHVALALTPRVVKLPVYRYVFGFKIARGARIGFSVLDIGHLDLADDAVIGHGNLLTRTDHIVLARGARIGHLNIVRGGHEVRMGPYSTVMRLNVLNSIPDNDAVGPTDARLLLGSGAYVVSSHRLDFTDCISLGKNVILAGRNSSLWTHNRQATRPIRIGDFCYLGSEVRIAPGASLGDFSILGMGAVLAGAGGARTVLGGVPAKPIRSITEEDERTLRKKSHEEIPDDCY